MSGEGPIDSICLSSTEIRVKVQQSVNTIFRSPLQANRVVHQSLWTGPAKHVESLGRTFVVLSDTRKVAMECCDVAFHDSPDRVMYSDSCAYLILPALASAILTAS